MSIRPKTPADEDGWELLARGLIKAHMRLQGMRYHDLRDALERIGVVDAEYNVRNRINRGRFTAIYFLQCLRAMEVEELLLPVGPWPGPPGAKAKRPARHSTTPSRRPRSPAGKAPD